LEFRFRFSRRQKRQIASFRLMESNDIFASELIFFVRRTTPHHVIRRESLKQIGNKNKRNSIFNYCFGKFFSWFFFSYDYHETSSVLVFLSVNFFLSYFKSSLSDEWSRWSQLFHFECNFYDSSSRRVFFSGFLFKILQYANLTL
jgi:hypothetical protein